MNCQEITTKIQQLVALKADFDMAIDFEKADILLIKQLKVEIEKALADLEPLIRWKGMTEVYFKDVETPTILPTKSGTETRPELFSISPDGTKIAIVDGKFFSIIDAQSKKEIYRYNLLLKYPNLSIIKIRFKDTENVHIAFAYAENNKSVFDHYDIDIAINNVTGAFFSSTTELPVEDQSCAYFVNDKNIIVNPDLKVEKTLPRIKQITDLALSPSGEFLLAECQESSIYGLIDRLAILSASTLEGEVKNISNFVLAHHQDIIACVQRSKWDCSIQIMNLNGNNGQLHSFLEFSNHSIGTVEVVFDYTDENVLAVDIDNNIVHVLNLETGKETTQFKIDLPDKIRWVATTMNNELVVGSGLRRLKMKIYGKKKR